MDATIVTSENAAEFYATRLPAPVPAPAPAVDDSTTAETTAEPKAESAEPTGDKKEHKAKRPIQPRINELVAERNEAQEIAVAEATRAQTLLREVEELRRKVDVLQTPAAPIEAKPRPMRTAFGTDEEFEDALGDWRAEGILAKREEADRKAKAEAERARVEDEWRARQETIRTALPDYDEVVAASEVRMPQWLLDSIMKLDAGPAVAYHLAKNPSEARRLADQAKSDPSVALVALGKLEDRITSTTDKKDTDPTPVKEKPKTSVPEISKAPPPIERLSNASSPVEKDPSSMSFAEFKAWRKATRGGRQ